MKPTCCDMPEPAPVGEAAIYRRIRDLLIRAHCSAKRDHLCCGAITLTRGAITLNCPLCGDTRAIIEEDSKCPRSSN